MEMSICRASGAELGAARAIRRAVFVEEQGVPEEIEVDGLDDAALHFLLRVGDVPAAAARARQTPKGWKLERVAVLRPWRGKGAGLALVRYMLAELPPGPLYLHAQESALGFWERAGFLAEGQRFFEAGIAHHRMLFPAPR